MNVVPLQVFVSLVLVTMSVLLLAYSLRKRDHEHADRLSLLPLDDDAKPASTQTVRAVSAPKRENTAF